MLAVLTAASELTSPSHPRILLVRISYSISLSLRISIHEFWNTHHTIITVTMNFFFRSSASCFLITITVTMKAEHFTSFFLLPPLVFWSQGQSCMSAWSSPPFFLLRAVNFYIYIFMQNHSGSNKYCSISPPPPIPLVEWWSPSVPLLSEVWYLTILS